MKDLNKELTELEEKYWTPLDRMGYHVSVSPINYALCEVMKEGVFLGLGISGEESSNQFVVDHFITEEINMSWWR